MVQINFYVIRMAIYFHQVIYKSMKTIRIFTFIGSGGSSFYSSSDTQLAYPALTNQILTTKDLPGTLQNQNNNNNRYPYNNNQLANSNTYGGLTGSNNNLPPNNNNMYSGSMGSNNNLPPNSNIYSGSMGSSGNLVPNSNSYAGYMGAGGGAGGNANSWSNPNQYYRYNQNSANAMYPNRDTNYNTNNNNRYSNINPFNNSYRLTTSILIIFLSIIAPIILHL